MKLVTLFAQHSTAQHSTAQHSTAQHSTAQHSTAQHSTARLTFNRISTALFITFSTFTVLSAQAEELPLGIATGTNSFAIGQNSFTTATNGIASGTEAVAIGGEKTKEEFVEAKNKQQDLINTIQTHRNTISTHDRAIFEKQNEITLKATELSVYERNKRELVAKQNQKTQFESRKTEKETALTEKEAAVNAANEAANKVKNGDKFITFYDMLVNLDWQENKSYSDLAGELKTQVDDKFGEQFQRYDNAKYEEIIRLYQRRYGEIDGKVNALNKAVSSILGTYSSKFALYSFYNPEDADYKVNKYYNNLTPNSNYIEGLDYKLNSYHNGRYNDMAGDDEVLKYLFDLDFYAYGGNASDIIPSKSLSFIYLSGVNTSFETENTRILQAASLHKAKQDNKFNALYTSAHKENYDGGRFDAVDGYLDNRRMNSLDPEFKKKYNKSHFDNYSLIKGVRFAFKKKDSDTEKVAPLGLDPALGILDKLNNPSTESRITVEEAETFIRGYKYITEIYKEKIDWDFSESAINLTHYKPQLDKVLAYYEKVNDIAVLTKEIVEESEKVDSNQDLIDEKNKKISARKKEVLAGLDDLKNFFAGIEIQYTEHARKYLEYGKDEADKLIHRLNTELNIYNPEDVLIKGVDTEIARLKQNYDDAVREKNTITTEIENITAEIEKLNKELEKEQEVSDLIAQKEREKAALEAEKTALEDKKAEVETALEKAKTDLANSDFNRLGGENSYAQGFQAFASGNNAIAIGTQAQAIKHGSIALGNQAKALGFRSVAIGESAVALSDNSVALGAGSYAIRGAISQPYDAPIGNGRTARTPTGTVGEVSVGRTKEDGSQELRQITHVAAGTADTDAVNVWQLKKAIESVGGGSFDPEQLYVLNRRIDGVESRLKQGVANAVAVASLPQAIHPSQHALSVGTGNYLGATSVAIGYSRVSDNGRFMIKFNGSVSNKGAYTTGAGVGIFW